ncbi:MAG: hypothetical protein V3V97_03040 [Hyphomicrobiaceae bacterium]
MAPGSKVNREAIGDGVVARGVVPTFAYAETSGHVMENKTVRGELLGPIPLG